MLLLKYKSLLILCFAALAISCNQTVELNLPKYNSQLVVEFYLEDGKPLRAALQESMVFTDPELISIVDSALVVMSYDGQSDTLYNTLTIDTKMGKAFNYFNPNIISLKAGVVYNLYIKDRLGRELRGTTTYKLPVLVDSTIIIYNEAGLAGITAIFSDPSNEINYYRLLAYRDSITPATDGRWDARFNDQTFNGQIFSFNTGYSYQSGDTIISRLYSLTPEHYQFSESTGAARGANFNPFGQPAAIKSNVTGGIGIFTTLSFDEKTIVIP